jgi:catechol 2,3-dioxygenase-like lactoylglutathione lyase family enzyme
MIAYTMVGTNDLPRATAFYDALFSTIGAKRWFESDRMVAWTVDPAKPGFAVCKPYDGKAATVGNGVMIAIAAGSRAKVDAAYKKALELGAKDEGAAGPRGDDYYGGYCRDLDGNKLVFCHMGPG